MDAILNRAKFQTYSYAAFIGIAGIVLCYPLYLYIYCEQQCQDTDLLVPLMLYVLAMFALIIAGLFILIRMWRKVGFNCKHCSRPPYNPIQPQLNINRCSHCGKNVH
jgi:hypothetical protein